VFLRVALVNKLLLKGRYFFSSDGSELGASEMLAGAHGVQGLRAPALQPELQPAAELSSLLMPGCLLMNALPLLTSAKSSML